MTAAMTEDALFELLSLDCRVDPNGTIRYYNALGQKHRVHGPAIDRPDGYRAWYQNDLLHRVGGPAVEYSGGYRAWYQNGLQHRLDGAAVEDVLTGSYGWYINGEELTKAEWQHAVACMETV